MLASLWFAAFRDPVRPPLGGHPILGMSAPKQMFSRHSPAPRSFATVAISSPASKGMKSSNYLWRPGKLPKHTFPLLFPPQPWGMVLSPSADEKIGTQRCRELPKDTQLLGKIRLERSLRDISRMDQPFPSAWDQGVPQETGVPWLGWESLNEFVTRLQPALAVVLEKRWSEGEGRVTGEDRGTTVHCCFLERGPGLSRLLPLFSGSSSSGRRYRALHL